MAALHEEPLRSVADDDPCSHPPQLVLLVFELARLTSLTFLESGCPSEYVLHDRP